MPPSPQAQLDAGSPHTPREGSVYNLALLEPKGHGSNVCVAVGDGVVEPLPQPDALGEALNDADTAVLGDGVAESPALGDGAHDGDVLADKDGNALPELDLVMNDADGIELTLGDPDADAEFEGDGDPEGASEVGGDWLACGVAECVAIFVANGLLESRVERVAVPDGRLLLLAQGESVAPPLTLCDGLPTDADRVAVILELFLAEGEPKGVIDTEVKSDALTVSVTVEDESALREGTAVADFVCASDIDARGELEADSEPEDEICENRVRVGAADPLDDSDTVAGIVSAATPESEWERDVVELLVEFRERAKEGVRAICEKMG